VADLTNADAGATGSPGTAHSSPTGSCGLKEPGARQDPPHRTDRLPGTPLASANGPHRASDRTADTLQTYGACRTSSATPIRTSASCACQAGSWPRELLRSGVGGAAPPVGC